MATQNTRVAMPKPSFASVSSLALQSSLKSLTKQAQIAAMAPPTPKGQAVLNRENQKPSLASPPAILNQSVSVGNPSNQQLHQELRSSMSRLAVASNPLDDQHRSNISRAGLRVDDEQTQVSSSSTKPASIDGKSTTSGTTFALDEKESLRPDDSASAKAGDEDEFGSGPASGAQNSRVGSEAGSRAFRDQFYEITENIGSGSHHIHPLGRRTIANIVEEGPQITQSVLASTLPAPVHLPPAQLIATNGPSFNYQYQEPDEKLFEALETPKDRLFLLRLEQEVITFVRDSTEPMIDLPPCNSFCRLLAHKLADYYALTHFVDNAVSSVRLHRTPYCRLPTPLSALATAPTSVDPLMSTQPAMKIMRRAGLSKEGQPTGSEGNTAEGSMAPSKAGSEIGYDSQQGTGVISPADSNVTKDKSAMTREEREAKYKETRDRIFGPGAENADSTEAVNEVSRPSSRNEKKKKKPKNNDDGFTARSQYNAYYPQIQYPVSNYEQVADNPAYYSPYVVQANGVMGQSVPMGSAMLQQGYQHGFQPMVTPQAFSPAMNNSPMMSGYEMPNTATYSQQLPQHYYSHIPQAMGMTQQSPAMPSPALSNNGQFPGPQSPVVDQQWTQNGYSIPNQQTREQQQHFPQQVHNQTPITGAQSVPYQFGQLPVQPGVPGAKAQHPLPGSYKSQSFNPQTRAFVPNGVPAPPQMLHQGNVANNAISRSSAMTYPVPNNYSDYGQQAPLYPQVASMPASSPYGFSHESKPYGTRKSSAHSNATQSPVQSSLSKWGTPSHLPPKPPPPEGMPESHHLLPSNNQFNVNLQPVNGGQPVPSFQNGVYSMPGASPQTT